MPKHDRVLKNILFYMDQGHKGRVLARKTELLFDDFEKKSIDYGIMEKSKIIKVIPSDFGWSDIGSFYGVLRMCTSRIRTATSCGIRISMRWTAMGTLS